MSTAGLKFVAAVLLLSLQGPGNQANTWRGVTPLKSTRADVERLLGKPNGLGRYQFKEERGYVNYAETACEPELTNCECLVSKDTVLNMYIELEDDRRLSSFNFDKSRFKVISPPGDPYYVTYSSAEDGVVYTVSKDTGEVESIGYWPSARDCDEVRRRAKLN